MEGIPEIKANTLDGYQITGRKTWSGLTKIPSLFILITK
jgi:hypothetical protein